jgi:hypothetical protein
MIQRSLKHLANATVADTFTGLVARDRANTAEMLLYLGELDERRLHVPAGYPSMYAYAWASTACPTMWHASESVPRGWHASTHRSLTQSQTDGST